MTDRCVEAVIIEADGGSRGNPGPSAYGAVLKDAATGEVLAERGECIGVATNNVAEYRGLIAGLELAAEHAPEASIEVRMDSKLVVEQMSGNWKIKHPDMKPLALQANRLAPFGTLFTWVPRDRNKHADRLANEALDGRRDADGLIGSEPDQPELPVPPTPAPAATATRAESADEAAGTPATQQSRMRPWSPGDTTVTTLILVRHGVTEHTARKLFSSGLTGANPGLTDEGRDQMRATGEWLAPIAGAVDAIVSSPVRRTDESAQILSDYLDHPVTHEPGIAEMDFGDWDGRTFTEVWDSHADELLLWLGSPDGRAGGGESLNDVRERVLAGRDAIVARHRGTTIAVVSHVTPIKVLVADALGADTDSLRRMELSPASVSVISYYDEGPDGQPMASLRLFNARPTDAMFTEHHRH